MTGRIQLAINVDDLAESIGFYSKLFGAEPAKVQTVNPGADLHALTGRDEDRGGLLVAITERRSRADIDRLAELLGGAVAQERARAGEAVPA